MLLNLHFPFTHAVEYTVGQPNEVLALLQEITRRQPYTETQPRTLHITMSFIT
jgi:hypothetical protein